MARILLVEDDRDIAEPLGRALTREGYEVLTAADGRSAVLRALDEPLDLLILDIGLPELDGLEVCRHVRDVRPTVPILMLTARDGELDAVSGLDAGADDYVTKPFGPRELVARLQAALRRAGAASEDPVLRAEGLELDLAAHTLHRDGAEVHLTPIEFSLLKALMQHRGRLLTSRSLLVSVWGPEYAEDTRTLRTHLSNLRRKIDPDGTRRYVHTDPGVGYRFAA
jgi:two-component system, OmpR family, KDP operon response regulator KdpE